MKSKTGRCSIALLLCFIIGLVFLAIFGAFISAMYIGIGEVIVIIRRLLA